MTSASIKNNNADITITHSEKRYQLRHLLSDTCTHPTLYWQRSRRGIPCLCSEIYAFTFGSVQKQMIAKGGGR